MERIVQEAERHGRILGVRLPPQDDGQDEPWTASPSRHRKESPIVGELPETLELVLGNQIYIAKAGLHSGLRNRVLRLAAFQNPEFYKTQAMRLSTYDKPRVIACAEDHPHHIGLPRGCLDDLRQALTDVGIRAVIRDERYAGRLLDVTFQGVSDPSRTWPQRQCWRTRSACLPPRPHLARRSSLRGSSRNEASARSCSCIGVNCWTNG